VKEPHPNQNAGKAFRQDADYRLDLDEKQNAFQSGISENEHRLNLQQESPDLALGVETPGGTIWASC
jgi:hypothetical protein